MIEELEALARFMKDHRILHVKTDQYELTMHPDGFPTAEPPKADPKDKEVGPTGMSREQMRELFNQVFEKDFEIKPE